MKLPNYLNPPASFYAIDTYIPRRSIVEALRAALPHFSGDVLDVGCGYMPYKPLLLAEPSRATSYLGMDLNQNLYQAPDISWDGENIPRGDASFDSALATEVLEHCPDPGAVLREIARVLRPGGFFFFTVPFLWPLHDVPYDHFRYTPFALERLLKNAGFGRLEIHALGGWDASLAQMLALWLRRRPMPSLLREPLSLALAPLVRWLYRRDAPPKSFDKSVMLTGLAGCAWRL
jgi:SAM-dependent methyltransferase